MCSYERFSTGKVNVNLTFTYDYPVNEDLWNYVYILDSVYFLFAVHCF